MKKVILALVALTLFTGAFAQKADVASTTLKHSIGLSINPIVNGTLDFNYEMPLPKVHKKFSVGGTLGVSLGNIFGIESPGSDIKGIKVEPMARWYFTGLANNYGFYTQLKAIVGYYKIGSKYTDSYEFEHNSFCSGGFSVALGYQFKFKNPHWSIDANVGYRYLTDMPKGRKLKKDALAGSGFISMSDLFGDGEFSWGGTFGMGTRLMATVGVNYRF